MMTDEDLRESREGQGSEEVGLSRERLRGGSERVCGCVRRLCGGAGGREGLGRCGLREEA